MLVSILVLMRKDKAGAIQMRVSGKSYSEISASMHIPKSTLSDWLKNEHWSTETKLRLTRNSNVKSGARIAELDRIRGKRLGELYERARAEAQEEFEVFKNHPLFIAGLSLYWGEGDKSTRGTVRIATVDPGMLRVYLRFLTQMCGVEERRIKAWNLIYPDLEESAVKLHWAQELQIPYERFTKSTTVKGRHPTRKTAYGVCTLYTSSTYLKTKILTWLRLFEKELMRGT